MSMQTVHCPTCRTDVIARTHGAHPMHCNWCSTPILTGRPKRKRRPRKPKPEPPVVIDTRGEFVVSALALSATILFHMDNR